MKKRAKQTLEYFIKKLDEEDRPPEKGSWKEKISNIDMKDEKALIEQYFALNVIRINQESKEAVVLRILGGENVLTPALINKGWKFWKELDVNRNEKEAIENAIISWSELKRCQLAPLIEELEKLPEKDMRKLIVLMASELDILRACRLKLSDDLKKVMADSNSD
jgi:hypothetical protein